MMRRHGNHDNTLLFSTYNLYGVIENQRIQLKREIDSIDGNRLLNTSIDDLCVFLVDKYRIDVPYLDEDSIYADQRETQLDVSRDRDRYIRDRSRPHFITGTAIEVTVPFHGDATMFKVQPNTYTSAPPRAKVQEQNLIITVQGTNLNAEGVKREVDKTLAEVRRYLGWHQTGCAGFNDALRKLAKDHIEQRREKLLADQNLVAGLGFPLKKRADAPTTYVAPEVRRRLTPKMPQASAAPFRPEPVLTIDDYDHILSVISNMAHVMERSPSAFESMGEEDLRTHFLVQLNGQYEGQATGETFNYSGKTDILIRVNRKNVFIAECKYWSGTKKLLETIDQLLGYSSWRDTKVAVIVFSRQKNFSHVLEVIPQAVNEHPNYKRKVSRLSETSFRYVFSHRDDPNREMTLTVMAFNVPQRDAD